jgi:hypothetical protein
VKIGKENIESFIFDYHEGNLSDSEKTEVLNYIHIHPEYEVEFTQWAQSYLPYETSTDYGLTAQLIQPGSGVWYKNTWTKIAAPIVIATLLFLYLLMEENKNTISTPKAFPQEIKNEQVESASKTIETSEKNVIQINQPSSNKELSKDNSTISHHQPTTAEQIADSSFSETAIQQTTINEATNENKTFNTTISKKADSTNTYKSIQSETQSNKEGISKKRKSYTIKPTDKFIPTNPDF